MSITINNIEDILNNLINNPDWEWDLFFFKIANKKPLKLNLYIVKLESLKDTVDYIINNSLKFQINDKITKEYSPENNKDTIDCWIYKEEKDPVKEYYNNIITPNTSTFNKDAEDLIGYIFIGKNSKNYEHVYLLKKGSPLKNYKSTNVYFGDGDEIKPIKNKIYTLFHSIDCVFNQNSCYFISQNIEKLFGIKDYLINKAKKDIEYMENNNLSDILSTINEFKYHATKIRIAKNFNSFDVNRFDKLISMSIDERRNFFDKHFLHYDTDFKFDGKDRVSIEYLVKYLCNQTALDYDQELITCNNFKKLQKIS